MSTNNISLFTEVFSRLSLSKRRELIPVNKNFHFIYYTYFFYNKDFNSAIVNKNYELITFMLRTAFLYNCVDVCIFDINEQFFSIYDKYTPRTLQLAVSNDNYSLSRDLLLLGSDMVNLNKDICIYYGINYMDHCWTNLLLSSLGNTYILLMLLAHNINYNELVNLGDYIITSPLHTLTFKVDNPEAVVLLLAMGADPNLTLKYYDNTPLDELQWRHEKDKFQLTEIILRKCGGISNYDA